MINVALIQGGDSHERSISLETADAMTKLLDHSKYKIFHYDPSTDLKKLIEDAEALDVALLALHGGNGENGVIQGFLEMIGLPYTGSGLYSSRVCMNKSRSKQIFRKEDILTPRSMALRKGKDRLDPELIQTFIKYPLFMKPNADGSSANTFKVLDEKDLWEAWSHFEDGDMVLFEELIVGIEVTCAVIDYEGKSRALPTIEITPKESEFYDAHAKYGDDASDFFIPARVADQKNEQIADIAVRCHEMMDCKGYSRVDMILRGDEVFVLEINTLPGFTEHSLLPMALEKADIPANVFLDKIINLALQNPHKDNVTDADFSDRLELQEKALD